MALGVFSGTLVGDSTLRSQSKTKACWPSRSLYEFPAFIFGFQRYHGSLFKQSCLLAIVQSGVCCRQCLYRIGNLVGLCEMRKRMFTERPDSPGSGEGALGLVPPHLLTLALYSLEADSSAPSQAPCFRAGGAFYPLLSEAEDRCFLILPGPVLRASSVAG